MLPISDVPASLREFAALFSKVFNHSAQREHFEKLLAGMIASENRTIAGIHQRLVSDTEYDSLQHFMTDSPWAHDELRKARLNWVSQQLAKESHSLNVVAIDSTLVHHTGEHIHGVYWYYDYVNHNFCLGQKLVAATFVAPARTVPLGLEIYHRGFLAEQKLYLEQTKPAADAGETEWSEFRSLVEKYEENCKEHRTQMDLAGDLVDECERHKIPVDAFVLDGAFLQVELMDKIEGYGKAWITRLAKNRLVQLPSGRFDTIETFITSLPKAVFEPVKIKTQHGEERTYWAFAKNMKLKFWKKLRVVITYDNPELMGEPRIFVCNKLNWIQAQKILQYYILRDPIEHFFRDQKQELGLEDCQQRKKLAVLRYWELCFVAYTFLELVYRVENRDVMHTLPNHSIGQKSRSMKMQLLQSFVSFVSDLILDGKDPEELFNFLTAKRLNCLAS